MPSVKLFNMENKEVGTLNLSDAVFGVEYNEPAIHQAVVARLANDRQGTKSTLTRTEVRGGGRKPFRQKGTGNARQGSIRAPQWVGGGVVFAPKSRDFSKKLNEKAKEVALLSAISQKLRDDEIIFVDELKVKEAKTKEMVAFLKAFGIEKTVLLVMDNADEKVLRASANVANVSTIAANQISTYEVVKNAKIVMSKKAVEQIEEAYGK